MIVQNCAFHRNPKGTEYELKYLILCYLHLILLNFQDTKDILSWKIKTILCMGTTKICKQQIGIGRRFLFLLSKESSYSDVRVTLDICFPSWSQVVFSSCEPIVGGVFFKFVIYMYTHTHIHVRIYAYTIILMNIHIKINAIYKSHSNWQSKHWKAEVAYWTEARQSRHNTDCL